MKVFSVMLTFSPTSGPLNPVVPLSILFCSLHGELLLTLVAQIKSHLIRKPSWTPIWPLMLHVSIAPCAKHIYSVCLRVSV